MTSNQHTLAKCSEEKLYHAWQVANQFLLQHKIGCHWSGKLSTSALSTATAVSALCVLRQMRSTNLSATLLARLEIAVEEGCLWLVGQQNHDGGYGDTDRSHSNIATTLLVLSAIELAEKTRQYQSQVERAWAYVDACGRWEGLRRRYGKDKTFVVPILSNCALAGFVPWSQVAALPFEAAWLPQQWYRWARMPVVSYAVPALVAIGQASFHHNPPGNWLVRFIRRRALAPTLAVLRRMQPASGGYLEAAPLTSFVLMNLASIGNGHLPVAEDCLRFLMDTRLPDGSWPIDTNLATWVTSLSIHGLTSAGHAKLKLAEHSSRKHLLDVDANDEMKMQQAPAAGDEHRDSPSTIEIVGTPSVKEQMFTPEISAATVRWLLGCQQMQRHPFTGANPGGWGWTNLSGAVPDADDTPAALLALRRLDLAHDKWLRLRHQTFVAVAAGLKWLCRLQNRDGGMPTFCRGWGKLPFDRSGTDLTAHALRAIQAWLPDLDDVRKVAGSSTPSRQQLQSAMSRGLRYLSRHQRLDGSWTPLWFGNQDHCEEENPVYGTGKVLLAYGHLNMTTCDSAIRGLDYLRRTQNPDGGWGGGKSVQYPHPTNSQAQSLLDHRATGEKSVGNNTQTTSSTIEETAVALEALIQCAGNPSHDATIMRGLEWLADQILAGNLQCSWPIGFYFAKLWYHEQLYPAIFSLAALGLAIKNLGGRDSITISATTSGHGD
ncbi:MAG: squalene--hopene cyclase [Planctomycetales bacterium]|nr:squalene--hopene cyclase [Planctomycetales bacterium]